MSEFTDAILAQVAGSIYLERIRQDDRWGEQNHAPEVWLAILSEEIGEMATAMLRLRFAGFPYREVQVLREEAVQVAAVAVAFIESLDRGKTDLWEPLSAGERGAAGD